ncbi:triose-phosphate isomerase [Actinoplanes sp. NPDC051475]|uniref:triose-phosphate isomerase n=1 Tax=Actinoplanes sp. NPDC051475 TaxID=3157225 RepID=UPI00344BB384
MANPARRPLIAGNWKMNLGGRQGLDHRRRLADEIAAQADNQPQLVVLAPFTALPLLPEALAGTPVEYGAQDISAHDSGAFTGDISGPMLTGFGCRYVLAGHSERREHHGETDEVVHDKVAAALRHRLTPILCVGEPLTVRTAGQHLRHTLDQAERALTGPPVDDLTALVIAYEPVWAIGTGHVATPDDAQEVCGAIRGHLADRYGPAAAEQIRLLYGGSVKASSSAAILRQPDIDGALVGGASLDPGELAAIWRSAQPRT